MSDKYMFKRCSYIRDQSVEWVNEGVGLEKWLIITQR